MIAHYTLKSWEIKELIFEKSTRYDILREILHNYHGIKK
jgi:hypothetical protein